MPRSPKPESLLARELARRLLATLASDRIARTFMESYARQFDRPEATAHSDRRQELEVILDREILLAMAARVMSLVDEEHKRSWKSRKFKTGAIENPSAFQRDLVSALGRAAGWTIGDSMEFGGDLDIYRRLAAVGATRRETGRARNVPAGPFVDRCAILLDPSMLENIGRAAGRLLVQIESLTDKLFTEARTATTASAPR
jgi:hypothetical protein